MNCTKFTVAKLGLTTLLLAGHVCMATSEKDNLLNFLAESNATCMLQAWMSVDALPGGTNLWVAQYGQPPWKKEAAVEVGNRLAWKDLGETTVAKKKSYFPGSGSISFLSVAYNTANCESEFVMDTALAEFVGSYVSASGFTVRYFALKNVLGGWGVYPVYMRPHTPVLREPLK